MPTNARKNSPIGFRKIIHVLYQKITFKITSATATMNASTSGRRYHGSPVYRHWADRSIRRPARAALIPVSAGVIRLTTIVTTKQTDHAKIAIQKFCAMVEGNS